MSARQDAVFDRAQREMLEHDIYGTTKGAVRLHVLWHDLLEALPSLQDGGLGAIDVGAGFGQIAQRLAELGHDVTVSDPSAEMLERARAALAERGATSVRFLQASVQELPTRVERYDLVLCHAVLEWLAQPEEAVSSLARLVAPGGHLSLLFYNRNAAVLKRALAGDFEGARAPEAKPAPPSPLDPEVVRSWVRAAGLEVISKAGIRIFHDHLPHDMRAAKLDQLLQIEMVYRRREPFASLGQHVHFVCRAAS